MVPQFAVQAVADTTAGAPAMDTLFNFSDQSSSIGVNNGQTAPNYPAFGPLAVRIKLGQPLGGASTTALSLTIDQQTNNGCPMMWYSMQGYSDSNYEHADGPSIGFGNWVDASGTPTGVEYYSGIMTGAAVGNIDPADYYAFNFEACNSGVPVTIAAAPGAQYMCTQQGGPNRNYCYNSDVVGQPFMILTAPAAPHEPVVIVPGIMGSSLARVSDGKELWPDLGDMTSMSGVLSGDAYLDDIALDASGGQTVAMSTPDIVRTVTTTIAFIPIEKVFYKNLIDAFTAQGYVENKDLFVVPYDWRLDLRSQIDALSTKIDAALDASPNRKINVIAHSMGGVLVKELFADHTSPSFIDKLVLVGVPQLGSPKAFKILNYGDNLGLTLGPFDVLSSDEIKRIAQNMPAIYQLLPGDRYVNVDGGYVQDFRNGKNAVLGYAATAQLMTSDPADSRNSGLIADARTLHDRIDNEAVNAPDVYNIVGCSVPTISQFDLYDDGYIDVTRTTGDGTVPEVSAMNLADGFHNYFVLGGAAGINHTGLVTDARPLALITNIIEKGGAADSSLPQDISTSLADCVSGRMDTIEFSAHGPADLEVYDSAGKHAGLLPDGTAEATIPGSSYETIGKNVFVTVPASTSTVKAVIKKTAGTTATSTVTVKVKTKKVATYTNVPLDDASATAEVDLSGPDDENPILAIDEDGDGDVDVTSLPDEAIYAPRVCPAG